MIAPQVLARPHGLSRKDLGSHHCHANDAEGHKTMTPSPKFPTREAAETYTAQTHALAETPTEHAIASLVGRWARWHHRWSTKPTEANAIREETAWDHLRLALTQAEMEDTWLDPRS